MNDTGECPYQMSNSSRGPVRYSEFITPDEVADLARDIVETYTANGSKCGPIKQIMHWMHKHIRYIADEVNFGLADYWLFPVEVLDLGSKDCDGLSVLTASMLDALGIEARCVMGQTPFGYHMWVECADPSTGDWFLLECTNGQIYDWEMRSSMHYYPDIYINKFGCSLPEDSIRTGFPPYGW